MKAIQSTIGSWAGESGFAELPATFVCPDAESLPAFLAGLLVCHPGRSLLAVFPDGNQADLLIRSLHAWSGLVGDKRAIHRVPEIRGLRREWLPENEAARCAALDAALSGEPAIFVAEVAAVLLGAASPEEFRKAAFPLATGQTLAPEAIVERLVALDYDNEPQVGQPGEFSRRGGILDIHSPLYPAPVRIEFFGDEIESMRFFDPETQRSFDSLATFRIVPRGQAVFAEDSGGDSSFLDYFPVPPLLVRCDPGGIVRHLERFGGDDAPALWHDLAAAHAGALIDICSVGVDSGGDSPAPTLSPECFGLSATRLPSLPELGAEALNLHWQLLRDNLLQWHAQGIGIVACCGNAGEKDRLEEMLRDDAQTRSLPVLATALPLPDGVFFPKHKLILLSERELFGKRSLPPRRTQKNYRTDYSPEAAAELEDGCYAVHVAQGICLYHGVRNLEVAGTVQEVIELEFAEDARLFVPLNQATLVTRYIGGTKKLPRLSRIGATAWKNNRLSAQASAEDLAAELLRLEALRQHARGFAFSRQGDWEADFAAAFPYQETEDQTRAIAEVLADMADERPMDRLLCGDVGYGKTEVAMRAAFRAVMNGKQVAVLVPTTVLAQQHYITFRDRMAEYPIAIDMLSRFKTAGQQDELLERLALGQVDIVIGTHRLVQNDVAFADLGLLIIDEEQRFGVKHKEKLKQMRTSVDILTMTATPIPRTLYFSLAGLRNLSTIMTAPSERLPIRTVIAQFDKSLIRDAILREIERDGQIFFLHNRVRTIASFCRELARLVPEARFAIAHGQMPPHELEDAMLDFLHKKVDVLVCTTIIESGLDIPNANTIVIDHAERFGLAELYQLRGRVGRYHNQAYAYLLLPPMGSLPRNARERIAAVRQYTHLGAGFKLALRDLEIRGAGNILGQEQSGQIAAVGFELYCELLRDAVARLEHQPTASETLARVTMDTVGYGMSVGSGKLPAAIPPTYIEAENTRVACYRRLQSIHHYTALTDFAEELRDRFGIPPPPVAALLGITAVRVLAEERGIQEVTVADRRVLMKADGVTVGAVGGRLPRLQTQAACDQLEELAGLIRNLPAA